MRVANNVEEFDVITDKLVICTETLSADEVIIFTKLLITDIVVNFINSGQLNKVSGSFPSENDPYLFVERFDKIPERLLSPVTRLLTKSAVAILFLQINIILESTYGLQLSNQAKMDLFKALSDIVDKKDISLSDDNIV